MHETLNDVFVYSDYVQLENGTKFKISKKARNNIWKKYATGKQVHEFMGFLNNGEFTHINHIIHYDAVVEPNTIFEQVLRDVAIHRHDPECCGDYDWLTLPNGERIMIGNLQLDRDAAGQDVYGIIKSESGHMPNPMHFFKIIYITRIVDNGPKKQGWIDWLLNKFQLQ